MANNEKGNIQKSEAANWVKGLQEQASKIRQRIEDIANKLNKLHSDFVKNAALKAADSADTAKETQAPAQPAVQAKQPSAEQPKGDALEKQSAQPEAKQEAAVSGQPEQPEENAEAKPTEEVKPQIITTTTVEDGKRVETVTDETGKVLRVKKFWDPNAKKQTQPAAKQPRTGSAPRSDSTRPAQRPAQGARPQSGAKRTFAPAADLPRPEPQKNHGNKNKTKEHSDEKRINGKKALLTRDYSADYDEDRIVRRARTKKAAAQTVTVQKITNAVVNSQEVPIKVLSEKIGVPVSVIISQLFKEGIMKTINDSVDFDYAAYIASLHEVTLELKMDKTAEEIIASEQQDDGLENDTKRPPIVTVMGHVDHGKTSLLDAIRHTNVTSGEAGGITQHIGAYTVTVNGEQITFIDTPGHAAFTAMRARGAKITDVAINKMDKPHVEPDRVKQQLTEYGLLAEEWGGDTIMVPVSAKTGMGLDQLLESVLLVTEIKELKANPKKRATGPILEAKLDKGRGPVATVLVANGTLRVGDSLIAGAATGKIRAMFDDKGRGVKSAGPSMPVEVLGFSEVPQAGDYVYAADEKLVKKAAEERKNRIKLENARSAPAMNLGDLFGRISEGQLKTLNLIVKTDVQGSLEALKSSLEKISNDEVKVRAIHGGVGGINETDVMLAKASQAIIIGFNVRADNNAKAVAEAEGVDIRLYNVIYDAVDDVTAAMKGMLAPKFKETVLGSVEVREIFKITGVGTVAGGYVTSGKAVRNGKVRVYRNDVSIYDGNILALKRFKDDVKEVAAGYECGISVENYNDIKVGDVFEIYQMEEVAQ